MSPAAKKTTKKVAAKKPRAKPKTKKTKAMTDDVDEFSTTVAD